MNFDPSSLEILSVGGNKNTRGGEHVAWSEIRTSSSTKKSGVKISYQCHKSVLTNRIGEYNR